METVGSILIIVVAGTLIYVAILILFCCGWSRYQNHVKNKLTATQKDK